jgi:formylglycine-generating enzyme required for sulfatase activity
MDVRLPTEAEWEYACRAGATSAYSFGREASRLGEFAWFDDNSSDGTKPVAWKKPNAWGLYDMHGNVREWCSDWYGDYPEAPTSDPSGPRVGVRRVLRGGSWIQEAALCRAATRFEGTPDASGSFSAGFRIAVTPRAP